MNDSADWIDELGVLKPSSGPVTVLDESSIDQMAYLLDADPRELMVSMQCLLRLHDRPLPPYAMRTGKWSLDVPAAIAKSVVSGIVTTTVLQALGADSIPVAILSTVAPFLFDIRRVEVRASDLLVYASLRHVALDTQTNLSDLYQSLPRSVLNEITFTQFVDIVERLSRAGLVDNGKQGIRLGTWGRRGFRLTFAEIERSSTARLDRARAGSIVICTAIELEYIAVLDHLGGPISVHRRKGVRFDVGTFQGLESTWQAVLAQTGPGNVSAGIALERAVAEFDPQITIFVGVAGGRKDVQLGDVVAADAVYGYESGKDTEAEYFPRMKTQSSSFGLVNQAWATAREAHWQQRIKSETQMRRPEAVVKPIASGSVVVAHAKSRTAHLLDQYCGDAVAVDMESYGFLQTVNANPGIEGLVIRGISDLLTSKDEDSDRRWQPVAARHAAAFAIELLGQLPYPTRS